VDIKDILKLMEDVDQERLEAYLRMFDRILLYVLAANVMPSEAVDNTVDLWNKTIKKTIEVDVNSRTEHMEFTPMGRLARMREEPDGEQLRLDCVKAWKMARDLITIKLKEEQGNSDPDEDEDHFDLPPEIINNSLFLDQSLIRCLDHSARQ
jgi:hypothetical protein